MSFDHLHDKPYFMPSFSQADAGAHDPAGCALGSGSRFAHSVSATQSIFCRSRQSAHLLFARRQFQSAFARFFSAPTSACRSSPFVAQLPGAVAENPRRPIRARAHSLHSPRWSLCRLLYGRRLASLCDGRCVVERLEEETDGCDCATTAAQVRCCVCWLIFRLFTAVCAVAHETQNRLRLLRRKRESGTVLSCIGWLLRLFTAVLAVTQ